MSARRVAENFIKAHGRPKFVRLIQMFHDNVSGPQIAHEFSVSRQRVHQWKSQLGQERVLFVVDPEIEDMLGAATSGRTQV